METIKLKVGDIKPYERNAKKHDERQIKNVMESIKQFGFVQPVVVDKDNVLIIGHCRLIAAKRLQMREIDAVVAKDLSQEQVDKLRLLDNKLNESDWDIDLLLEDIPTLDFDGFDIDWGLPEVENPAEEVVEDEPPEPPTEPKAKLGDLYELGGHRLICGDSTDVTVIDRLMDGVKAKLLLTDPPYGIGVVKGNKVGGDGQTRFGKVGGGKIVKSKTYSAIVGDDTTDTARANYDVALTCTENQIIFGGNYFTDFLPPSRCWIVWDKQNTGNFADAELAWTSFDRGVKLYHFLWNGLCREGSREVEGKTRVHPTQKPVGMLADILKDFSEENDSILDCFGGSGSTLIACEQLNRKCYMCELDPHYVDVIVQRYINFKGTDEDVFLIRDGQRIPYKDVM
jgi:DNA modification methylase